MQLEQPLLWARAQVGICPHVPSSESSYNRHCDQTAQAQHGRLLQAACSSLTACNISPEEFSSIDSHGCENVGCKLATDKAPNSFCVGAPQAGVWQPLRPCKACCRGKQKAPQRSQSSASLTAAGRASQWSPLQGKRSLC